MSTARYEHANLFELTGKTTGTEGGHWIHITYATTGKDGQAHLIYDEGRKQQTFKGEQLRTAQTALGTEVTVTLEVAPDAYSKTLTILVPEVHVSPESKQARLSTCGIFATNRDSIAGPELVLGAVASYDATDLHGTAKLVFF